MSQDTGSLAEVFLGFGGKTFITLGTACTSVGVLYGVNRISGTWINFLESLPRWLSSRSDKKQIETSGQTDDNTALVTRKGFYDALTLYGKIGALIIFGLGVKAAGKWMGLDSTVAGFNRLVYKAN